MTRGEFKRQARALLRETRGTEAGDDDLLYDTLVTQVVDDICLETDCFYTEFVSDLEAGEAEYCAPNLYKIKAATILTDAGEVAPLGLLSPRLADRHWGGSWRNLAAETNPRYGIIGAPSGPVRLAPPPSEARTGGLTFEGFGTPGQAWGYDADTGAALAITDATECPIPTWAHSAVPPGLALQRCIQFPTPDNRARVPLLQDMYDTRVGNVGQRAAQHYHTEILGRYRRLGVTPL